MPDSTACGNCGETLSEPANTPVDQRQPCPKCGSTRRSFSSEMTGSLTVSGTMTAEVTHQRRRHIIDCFKTKPTVEGHGNG